MPPMQKISREMILNCGIEVIRNKGIENLNVRNLARNLNCSTQPIMYHFKNMELLKEELYNIADQRFSKYITKEEGNNDPLLNIGLQYVSFAVKEKNLFKFLFQSDKFSNFDFNELININEDGLETIFNVIQKETDLAREKIRELFEILFVTAHGLASLYANNTMKYDEKQCIKILESVFKNAFKE